MLLTPRRATDPRSGERGFTLVELLVVMLIMGAVGSVVMTSVVRAMRASNVAQQRIDAIHEIELATQRVSRELRAADPLVISPNGDFSTELGAEVYRDGKIFAYIYTLEDPDADGIQELIQSLSVYDLAALVDGDPSNDAPIVAPQRTLMTEVENGGLAEAAFRYYDADGIELTCTVDGTTTLEDCQSQLSAARQVKIVLVRRVGGDAQEPVRAETTINVRNMRYQIGGA